MITQEEHLQWNVDSDKVNEFVDGLIHRIKNVQEGEPVVYMAVDMIFRSYLQWIHSAQALRADPESTRSSLINVINVAIMDVSNRIRGVDENKVRIDLTEWVSELMQDLAKTLLEDCANVEPPKKIIRPN